MHTREELEEQLSYETIIKMFYKCENVRYIRNLIKKRYQEKTELTSAEELDEEEGETELLYRGSSLHEDLSVFGFEEYIEEDLISEIRAEIIHSILKNDRRAELKEVNEKGEQVNPVKYIFGYAKKIVRNRICEIIEINKEARERLEVHRQKPPIVNWPFDPFQEDNIFAMQRRERVFKYFNLLSECEKTVLTLYVIEEKKVSMIAKQLNLKESKVSQIKHNAWRKIEKSMIEAEKEEMRKPNSLDLYHTESLLQEPNELKIIGSILHSQSQGFLVPDNPGIQEDKSMDSDYTDMLLHTIYEVSQILPISDLFDEHIMGRLTGKQKDILEEHLRKCDECSSQFETRESNLSALKRVFGADKETN